MKIAVIGSGIAGLAAAWYLSKHHHVTLCERGPSIGMDAHSVEVGNGTASVYINAPMRVFFEGYYPTLSQLYRDIGIEYEPIKYSGSFSRRGSEAYFQYKNHWLGKYTVPFLSGSSASTPASWRLGWDLVKFLRLVRQLRHQTPPDSLTVEEFVRQHQLSPRLTQGFLYPTFAGICTCSYEHIKAYPASVIIEYLSRDLTWSRVNRLTHGVRDVAQRLSAVAAEVHCNVDLKSISVDEDGVLLSDGGAYQQQFDHVVVATQANQAIGLLPATMCHEQQALAQIKYQQSRLVVHGDRRLAPQQSSDWAPVNFVLSEQQDKPMASIWLNSIYPELETAAPLFETWNPFYDIEPQGTLIDIQVDRPVVTPESLAAIQSLQAMQQHSKRRVWLCGSYAARGIPLLESAVVSAKAVADRLDPTL